MKCKKTIFSSFLEPDVILNDRVYRFWFVVIFAFSNCSSQQALCDVLNISAGHVLD